MRLDVRSRTRARLVLGAAGALATAVALIALTAMPLAAKTPKPPAVPVPTDAELMEMMNRNMGKAPVKQTATTEDGVQVVFQTGHSAQIGTVAVSADRRYILSGAMDETAKLWDVASGQEVRTFSGFDTLGPRGLAFSHDGTRAVIGDLLSLKVYDLASGRQLLSQTGVTLWPVMSGDGRFGVQTGQAVGTRSPQIVDLATGQTVWKLPGDDGAETAVTMSYDGSTLITMRMDTKAMQASRTGQMIGELRAWDIPARKLHAKLPPSTSALGMMTAVSPDGHLLLMLSQSGNAVSASVVDIETGQKLLTLAADAEEQQGMTDSLTFSPDGRMAAWATSTNVARVWEIPSGKLLLSLEASAVAFSADSRTLVLGRASGGAPLLRDIESGEETALTGGAAGIADLVLTKDGGSAVAAMDNGDIKQWDLGTGQIVRSFQCAGGVGASSVSVSGSVPLLAAGCMDGSALLWDLASGRELRKLAPPLPGKTFTMTLVRFSGDGRLLALAMEQQVSLLDVAAGREIGRVTLPAVPMPQFQFAQKSEDSGSASEAQMLAGAQLVRALSLHPGGELVAIGRTYQVSLWNLRTGQLVSTLSGTGAASKMTQLRQPVVPEKGRKKRGDPSGMLGDLMKQSGSMAGGNASVIMGTNVSDLMDVAGEQFEGARSLTFSPDGRLLLALGSHGPRFWDVATTTEIIAPTAATSSTNPMDMMNAIMNREMVEGAGVAFNADGRLAARGLGRIIKVLDVASGRDVAELIGHTSDVTALAFTANGRSLVSAGHDGAVRVWNVSTATEVAALIALGHSDYVAVTPDQYYRASKSRIKGVSFRVHDQLYPFEQFDLRFNRPDIVLERLGTASPELVQSYRYAYQHRLQKMGFTEAMLGTDFHLPEIEILSKDVPVSTLEQTITLRVHAKDDQYALDRLNVFVNDVPIHGSAGLPLADRQAHESEQEIRVPLVAGRNKVQVSALNQQGTESLKQTVYTNATGAFAPPDTYVVAIGVSQYQNSGYNLRYAAKDANDLLGAYEALGQRSGTRGQVHVLRLTDDKATRAQIQQAKPWLAQARPNDLVVVFAAGHGLTDSKSNYYFGTYDIDAEQPGLKGLPYEEFEALLDGIPAIQKMLLLDTCFSGEIDKEDQTVVAQADTGGNGTVKMRSFKAARGVTVVADSTATGSAPAGSLSGEMLRFQQDWFADLRRGTGAAVISSSSGNEYSLEGEQWNNGVFTYSLLQGLKNGEADANKDRVITVSELQAYVIDEVRKLTRGGQNPTARRENLEYDFPVY